MTRELHWALLWCGAGNGNVGLSLDGMYAVKIMFISTEEANLNRLQHFFNKSLKRNTRKYEN